MLLFPPQLAAGSENPQLLTKVLRKLNHLNELVACNRQTKMATVDKRQEEHVSFGRLGLDEWLVNQCKTMGLSKPTEIQQNCIPRILTGKVK